MCIYQLVKGGFLGDWNKNENKINYKQVDAKQFREDRSTYNYPLYLVELIL